MWWTPDHLDGRKATQPPVRYCDFHICTREETIKDAKFLPTSYQGYCVSHILAVLHSRQWVLAQEMDDVSR